MPKTTTRFIAGTGSGDRLLVSITERVGGESPGDLVIYFPRDGFVEDGLSGVLEKTSQNRISVHVSPKTVGHTINGHVESEKYYNPGAHFELNENRPLWLIGIFSPMVTDTESQGARVSPNTEILSLGNYDPDNFTLCYSLWLSRIDLPEIEMSGFFLQKDFSYFRIMMMWHHVNIPSLPEGYTSFWSTYSRKVDGISDGMITNPRPDGYSASEAQILYTSALQRFSVRLYQVHRRYMVANGMDVESLQDDLKARCCTALDPNKASDDNRLGIDIIANPYSPLFDSEIPPALTASHFEGSDD